MVSVDWQALIANYWPYVLTVIGAILGWNNRKEIIAKMWSGASGVAPASTSWPAEKAAPDGTTQFIAEVIARMDGVPAERVVALLSTADLTPDVASKEAAAYFRSQVVKP